MNHLPFVVAAYVVALGGLFGLLGWSFVRMRRAERAIDRSDRP